MEQWMRYSSPQTELQERKGGQTVTQIDIYYVDKCECVGRQNVQHMDECAISNGIYVVRPASSVWSSYTALSIAHLL